MRHRRTKAELRKTRLTPERRDLAARYAPLARSIARGRGADSLSDAYMTLTEAARDYPDDSPITFATFARRRIEIRLRPSRAPMYRFTTIVPEGYAFARGYWILAQKPARPERDIDAADAAEGVLRRLPRKHAETLRPMAFEGLNQREAATRTKRSPTLVARHIAEARQFLAG